MAMQFLVSLACIEVASCGNILSFRYLMLARLSRGHIKAWLNF